ncbi:DUF4864 domain-containing protein [Primorskyibacter marinus]|uniref:DUF4864 domain-containing protein n=1 Tax=Primorskyibacter marinus TaxID=1977320 RepID=UPI000E304128|nr:DUF4864 domain-containing protein [Primorskyibacter marinus]
MRSLIFGLVAAVALAGGVAAQDTPETGIKDVISSQLEAFRQDDFARAFSFASPSIQGMFGSPENFGGMVQNGYPMVWRPGRVDFLELRQIEGSLWQKVQIVDQSGRVHLLDYQMVEGRDGWRIGGVQMLELPGMAV